MSDYPWRIRRSRRALLATTAFALVGLVGTTPQARAATVPCSTICSGTSGNCDVTTVVTVAPGSEIDCTGRAVYIKTPAGALKVEDGSLKLAASSLTVEADVNIRSVEVVGGGTLGIDIDIANSIAIVGALLANSASGGGRITVKAGGSVTVNDSGTNGIEASGTGPDGMGGDVSITAGGAITIYDPIRADATSSAGSAEANGGTVRLSAGTDVNLYSSGTKIVVDGIRSDAGTIEITAAGDIGINSGTSLQAEGKQAEGNGGVVDLTAQDKVTVAGTISARGGVNAGGGYSSGGSLRVESGCGGVDLLSTIDVRGGELGAGIDGGAVEVAARGDINVGSGVLIDTHSVGNGGPGGDVSLRSGGTITLGTNAIIDARGDTSDVDGDGQAGSVEIVGCEIEAGSGASVKATGLSGGAINIYSALVAGSQTTTMHINSSSSFDTAGTTSSGHGELRVAVATESLVGYCETAPATPCTLDANCTVGCQPGNCVGLNPDTDNVLTQFKTPLLLSEERDLTGCDAGCAQ